MLRHSAQGSQEFVILRAFGHNRLVARQAGSQQQQGIVGGGIQVNAHLVVGGGHNGAQCLLQQLRADGSIGGVERQHGGHVGGNHAAALADRAKAAGFAGQLKFNGIFFLVSIGGHNGLGSFAAALGAGLQPGRCGGNTAGERVNRHGLADNAGGSRQNILGCNAQLLGHQGAALIGQIHTVGGAGVGVATVHQNSLCVAVHQVGAVNLDGGAIHLVGGVNTGSGTAYIRLDDGQIQLVGIGPEPGMYAGSRKTLGSTNAAGNDLILCHVTFPLSHK